MVKHTQTIRRQQPTNCLRVFDHFLSGMKTTQSVATFTNSKIKILD